MISVTETAAEKINKSLSEQDMEGKALRLGVFVGGCSGGYQYALGPDQELSLIHISEPTRPY